MVAKQEVDECENQIGNPLADESTDFKYGPGFVSKLRYKYLTLTLRQTAVSKQRPSIIQLRRTTSLNNLLDDNEDDDGSTTTTNGNNNSTDSQTVLLKSSSVNKENGNCTNGSSIHHNNGSSNGNGIVVTIDRDSSIGAPQVQLRTSRSIEKQLNLKRARSVEALLRDDEPIVSPKSPPTIEDKICSARERPLMAPPKRLVSLIEDDERPPPGICKQTMRLFETTNGKKRTAMTRPMSNEIANKIALFKGTAATIEACNKPSIGKKPLVPPRTTSPHLMNNSEKFAKFSKEKQTLPKLDINIIKNNLETKTNGISGSGAWSPADNKEIYRINSSFSPVNSDTSSPNAMSPFRNSLSPQLGPDAPKSKSTTNVKSSYEYTAEMNAANNSSSTVNSPLINSLSCKLSNLHMDNNNSGSVQSPPTSATTPKNNSWTNSNNNNTSKSNNLLKIIDDSSLSDKETNGISADNSNGKVSNCDDYNGAGRVISFSQKVHNIKPEREKSPTPEAMRQVTANSNGEMAKSNGKCEPSPAVIQKPTHAPPAPPIKSSSRDNDKKTTTNTTTSSSSPEEANKWTTTSAGTSKKKSWSSQQNDDNSATSIVFNFSDRKDVPDYIENDGLIIRRRNEMPKPHDSGYVLLGDLTLDSSTDPEDVYHMQGPPSPCDVEFTNANIVPEGKSSIRSRPKGVKFKLQFDDSLTETFEYPSENSLLIDDAFFLAGGDDVVDDADTNSSGRSNSTTSKLLTSVPSGSTPFGNYQPQKASAATFELGITRTTPSPSSASSDENTFISNHDSDSDEYLKPATDEESKRWSCEGTRGTDLLF